MFCVGHCGRPPLARKQHVHTPSVVWPRCACCGLRMAVFTTWVVLRIMRTVAHVLHAARWQSAACRTGHACLSCAHAVAPCTKAR
eukprot:7161560-Alexandrium_andersonii.AAC.1